jgi:uncharacterized protein YhbP (UPF0306 family)
MVEALYPRTHGRCVKEKQITRHLRLHNIKKQIVQRKMDISHIPCIICFFSFTTIQLSIYFITHKKAIHADAALSPSIADNFFFPHQAL